MGATPLYGVREDLKISPSPSLTKEGDKKIVLTPQQQTIEALQKNNRLLIVLPGNLNGDALGCALALEEALKNSGKKIDIVCAEDIPEKLKWLPGQEKIKNKITAWQDFIISVNTVTNKISRLRYENETGTLKIFLTTPQKVEEKDIRLEPGQFFYDLIVTIDAPDLESLGRCFEENTELFFGKSILNIDHKASNEHFGEINFIQPTAAACAEIIAKLIPDLGLTINEKIATLLLTGLIIKTRSFQNNRTTPQSLSLASSLINQGAEQEKIIQQLYKTKPLNKLQLWGRLLSRLDFDEQKKIAWILVAPEDFTATDTSAKDINFILEETLETFPQINLVLVFWPEDNGFFCILAQAKQVELLQKINAELAGSLKNDQLFIKTSAAEPAKLREKITALLNSNE